MAVKNTRNVYLDAMRGLAAIIVVLTHIRQLFFVPYSKAGNSLIVKFIYIDHYVARAAVIYFFVLSGYLVGTSVLKSVKNKNWSWKKYAINRISRLYVVLIPALLLTAVFDSLGLYLKTTHEIYQYRGIGGLQVITFFTLKNFLGCLLFLQTLYTDWFGSNSPLWSLSNEFWYYILFPIGLQIFIQTNLNRLFLILIFAAISVFIGSKMMSLFPCWLLGVSIGVIASKFPLNRPKRRYLFILSSISFLVIVVLSGAHMINLLLADYLFSICSTALIFAALSSETILPTYLQNFSIFISEISFTLYLTHLPLLYFVCAFFLGANQWKPDLGHLLLMVIPLIICVGWSYINYRLFESQTDYLRNFLLKHFIKANK